MADPFTFSFDTGSARYRNASTGRYVSNAQITGLRDAFADRVMNRTDAIASRLVSGGSTISEFESSMRQHIRDVHLAEYALGRGGREVMTQADFGRTGYYLRDQYAYLRAFRDDIVAGKLTDEQIAARARLYTEDAIGAFERGRLAAFEAAGVQYVKYVTAGERTCGVCLPDSGKIFNIREVPAIPRHMRCRCTVTPTKEAA